MRKNGLLLISTLVMLATTNAVSAEKFRGEININGSVTESGSTNFPNAIKEKNDLLSGTYYFNEVTTNSHPLAEAAFLQRSSSVSLAYSQDDFRIKYVSLGYAVNNEPRTAWGILTHENTSWTAAVNFYIPNSIFYIGGRISESHFEEHIRYDTDDLNDSSAQETGSYWRLHGGITPAKGLLLWSEFYKDQEVDDEWNINAKYVMDWNGNALNLEASYDRAYNRYESPHIWSNNINDTRLTLAADYYLDRTLSLGVTYDHYDLRSWDTNYGLRLRKFFTNKFAIDASFATSDRSEGYEVKRYLVGATLRM